MPGTVLGARDSEISTRWSLPSRGMQSRRRKTHINIWSRYCVESERDAPTVFWEHKAGQSNLGRQGRWLSPGFIKNRDLGKSLPANTWECNTENQDRSKMESRGRNTRWGVHCPCGHSFRTNVDGCSFPHIILRETTWTASSQNNTRGCGGRENNFSNGFLLSSISHWWKSINSWIVPPGSLGQSPQGPVNLFWSVGIAHKVPRAIVETTSYNNMAPKLRDQLSLWLRLFSLESTNGQDWEGGLAELHRSRVVKSCICIERNERA